MKRVFTLIGAVLFATMGFNSAATAQVEQGNFIIDPYIGFPTSNLAWGALTSNTDFRTVGPPISFGGRAEFMVADNFGVGADVNYAISGYQYTEENYYYDADTDTFRDATFKYTAKKLRAMLRLNYHFVQTGELDAYVGFGAGYRNVKRTAEYDGDIDDNNGLTTGVTLIPVSFRLAIGGRYYFTDNIGAMMELGTSGGSAIQVGLSVKI